jgi:hypothetical protein
MPYETVAGSHELASRLGHSAAAVRAVADARIFHVPAEELRDAEDLRSRVRQRADFQFPGTTRLTAALAIDGSYVVERIRDGLPSVLYGFAQTAAAFVDLTVMESQRAERFVDPYEIERAVNTALVTLDLPVAGAYTREGVDIATSWRESIDHLFRVKKIEVNRLDQSLLDLLFLVHGRPDAGADTVPVNCLTPDCSKDVPVAPAGRNCDTCGAWLFPTDVLRIHEEVGEEGANQSALGRLMSVVELLVLVGLATLLWKQSRHQLLPATLFIVDGPLAMYGPPAKLRGRALDYFQRMHAESPDDAPYICGLEKTGPMVDFARQLARHDIMEPGQLMICDEKILGRVTNATNVRGYGKETYWGRKFIYRAVDGRVVVPTIMPATGDPYDAHGGKPDPQDYPTLPAILDVIDRTGSSMYVDGIIPVAAAHGKAAFPIGVGTDVLRLVAAQRLGLE